MATNTDNVFGQVAMGYVVIGSTQLQQWKTFLQDAIGLHLASESKHALAFRVDNHAKRLMIEDNEAEDILAIGWQLSEGALKSVLARVHSQGVNTTLVEGAKAHAHGVACFHHFTGPKGLRVELFSTPLYDESPLNMLCSGFVTGDAGLGHISLMSREPTRTVAFWQSLFDARVSDMIDIGVGVGNKTALDVAFLRLNQRHHSIAIAATRGLPIDMFRTRIQHFNLEAATLNDLIAAHERCKALGFSLSRSIGQHPNDKELSFYVSTPSGFDFEIGWDALTVNEATWQSGQRYNQMSTWGHEIPGFFSSELRAQHLFNAAKSLTQKEFIPW